MLDIMTDAVVDIMVVNRGGRSATWLGPPALENLGGAIYMCKRAPGPSAGLDNSTVAQCRIGSSGRLGPNMVDLF